MSIGLYQNPVTHVRFIPCNENPLKICHLLWLKTADGGRVTIEGASEDASDLMAIWSQLTGKPAELGWATWGWLPTLGSLMPAEVDAR